MVFWLRFLFFCFSNFSLPPTTTLPESDCITCKIDCFASFFTFLKWLKQGCESSWSIFTTLSVCQNDFNTQRLLPFTRKAHVSLPPCRRGCHKRLSAQPLWNRGFFLFLIVCRSLRLSGTLQLIKNLLCAVKEDPETSWHHVGFPSGSSSRFMVAVFDINRSAKRKKPSLT